MDHMLNRQKKYYAICNYSLDINASAIDSTDYTSLGKCTLPKKNF